MFSVDFRDQSYAKAESASPLIFVVGVQGVDSYDENIRIAVTLKQIFEGFGVPFLYKSVPSDGKNDFARRMDMLRTVRERVAIPVTANLSEPDQLRKAVELADVFILNNDIVRMHELLTELGQLNKPLILGKDLYSFSGNMESLAEYARGVGIGSLALCENGTFFGYDIVVDMRSLSIMQRIAPVFFNVSYAFRHHHAGQFFFNPCCKVSMVSVAYAAAAQGLAGIIMDVLPDRTSGDSGVPGMVTLGALPSFLEHILEIDRCVKNFCA